ncbi:MAG: hypothetical protein LUI14_00925 [Lachnospiraceae bacterium]|nr:hypothetical protein [Lachnospiraceae bacterium]
MKPKFDFVQYKGMGMSDEQIEYIKKLVDEYMQKYPKIQLNRVCDFYSWDHSTNKFSETLYTHNNEGKRYLKVDDLAKHNEEFKLIGFNHIRVSGMPLEDEGAIQRVIDCKQRLYAKYIQQVVINRIKISDFEKMLNETFLQDARRHDINFTSLSMYKMDVFWIRLIEESKSIKRLTVHELAHAISQGYNLEKDSVVQSLYEEYKLGFENLKEFIAECIMAAELTDKISLANKVKARIC